jgi:tRNA (cytidine/uridine-2'-O-)-methyltransferase
MPDFKIQPTEHNLTIVLLQPDIPQNTGNIARLCYATGCRLVLVRPLGFRLTDAGLERAGMDYWKSLEPVILDDIDEFLEWAAGKNLHYLSAHAEKNYAATQFKPADVLVFGSESAGLPGKILQMPQTREKMIGLPMIPSARCLNVSSSAAAVTYEALRQIHNWSSSGA